LATDERGWGSRAGGFCPQMTQMRMRGRMGSRLEEEIGRMPDSYRIAIMPRLDSTLTLLLLICVHLRHLRTRIPESRSASR
jgi:hypothetical protein